MQVAEQTVVNLFEIQSCPIEDIVASLELPLAFVLDVLERKSPKYKAMLVHRKQENQDVAVENSVLIPSSNGMDDISDAQFERIKQEAIALAVSPDSHPFIRANMCKFLWNKKRPETQQNITINVQALNQSLQRAREIRERKLQPLTIETTTKQD